MFPMRHVAMSVASVLALAGGASAGADQPLAGKKLLLHAAPRLEILSLDRTIGLGGGAGSADDPTLAGGSLRLVTAAGDGFDATYPLDGAGWRPLAARKPEKGWKYAAGGPITKVMVKAGKQLKVLGKGTGLALTLGENPDPVDVILTLGAQRYCLRFGGEPRFKAGKKYLAKKTQAPDGCAPGAATTTSTVPTTTTTTATSTTTTTIESPCSPDAGLVFNGCFELPVTASPSNGWSFANQDGAGGWKDSTGNPGGCFYLNESGQLATDPTVSQTVTGLTPGAAYRLTGDYRSVYSGFGNPGKADAFAARIEPQPLDHGSTIVLALPRPSPDADAWTAFGVDFTASAAEVTVTFEAERGGDDSSFAVDNVTLRELPQ